MARNKDKKPRNKGKKLGGVPSTQAMRTARDDLRRAAQLNRNIASAQEPPSNGLPARPPRGLQPKLSPPKSESVMLKATQRFEYLSPGELRGVWSPQRSGGWGFAACDTELGADYALIRAALANIDTAREIEPQRGPPVDTDLLRAVIDVLDKAQMSITNGKGAIAIDAHNAAGELTAFGVLLEARNALWGEEETFGGMVDDPDDDGGALLSALYRLRDLARRLGLGTLS